MALRGTLKDFGIADIFQLVGHQGKTGQLLLRNREQEVRLFFKSGDVVRAESSTRQRKDLLGALMVRAEALTQQELEQALAAQKTSLRRLGDLLIERQVLTPETLQAFMRLQATETVYRLFLWTTGTYEFEAGEVSDDGALAQPLDVETVLMDGFRMKDEWPTVRKTISGYDLTFERGKDLDEGEAPATGAGPAEDDFSDLDMAFDSMDGLGGEAAPTSKLGASERLVHKLAVPGRDVQKIIDLARLGEFETCKALAALVQGGYLTIAATRVTPESESLVGGISATGGPALLPAIGRAAVYLAVAVAVLVLLHLSSGARFELLMPLDFVTYREVAVQDSITRVQLGRLSERLEAYLLLHGQYPQALDELVDVGLARPEELRYPWQEPYYYRRLLAVPQPAGADPTPSRPYLLLRPVQ